MGKYLDGKKKLMGFFVGQVMKVTKGKANPKVVNKILAEELEKTQVAAECTDGEAWSESKDLAGRCR